MDPARCVGLPKPQVRLLRPSVLLSTSRFIKCLAIVNDATYEATAVVPEHSVGGERLTRLLNEICAKRGKPAVMRTGNGREFTGKALLN